MIGHINNMRQSDSAGSRNKDKAKKVSLLVAILILALALCTACCDQGGAGQKEDLAAKGKAAVEGEAAKMRSYTITKISGLPEWDKIPKLDIDNVVWLPDAGISAFAQLCYDDEDLYVHLGAKEKYIRAENTKPLSAVNEDSCLEFFFMPADGDRYFNFEINPNGCLHYEVGHDRTDRLSLYREDEKQFFDIKADRTKDGWEVFYRIPVKFIEEFYPGYRFEGELRANMYKCGDKTKQKHYISWNPMSCSNPDFHRPEDFGTMKFGTDVKEMTAYAPDYMVLVNKKAKLKPDFIKTVKLENIKNTSGEDIQVETMALRAFNDLRDDLKAKKNITIGIDSAYRSIERQKELMKEFTEQYGAKYAKETVAEPGTSEHHTGLAIDLVPKVDGKWLIENEDMMKQKEVFKEIHKMLPEYGFILRYPKGKEKVTGYSYEPWHLRYVGDKKVAKEIYCKGITFEEYLNKE